MSSVDRWESEEQFGVLVPVVPGMLLPHCPVKEQLWFRAFTLYKGTGVSSLAGCIPGGLGTQESTSVPFSRYP